VHADDGEWSKRAREILEMTGGDDIASADEPKGDFANSERPVRRL
jgi:hypothetical protein